MGALRAAARLGHPQQSPAGTLFAGLDWASRLMDAQVSRRADMREYHVERARAELDAAYRAAGTEAAKAHFRLCSMHMAKARSGPEQALASLPELEWIESCRPLHEKCLAPAG